MLVSLSRDVRRERRLRSHVMRSLSCAGSGLSQGTFLRTTSKVPRKFYMINMFNISAVSSTFF